MTEKNWYDEFSRHMNTVFTEEEFEKYKKMIANDLDFYKKYMEPGSRVLDLGCGLGCTAVPLSALGYKIVGIDSDPKVVEAAKQNAKNFGKDIEVIEGDVFELDKLFEKDSFDACISGGLLEHFKKEKIRELVSLQLKLSPLVIASMPVKTELTKKHYGFTEETALDCTFPDGIYRNFWSENEWTRGILAGFNIVEHFVKKIDPVIANFEEIFVVIRRK